MTVSINGTTGISGVDGSAATPALQGSDTNTGISFGTDEVAINTGGTARATVDSSGRLGLGTSNPDSLLEVRDSLATGIISRSADTQATNTNKALKVRNNSDTDTFTVSYKGQGYFADSLGVGTTSPGAQFEVKNTGNVKIYADANGGYIEQDVSNLDVLHLISSGFMKYQSDPQNDTVETGHIFECDGTERARIENTGRILINTTTNYGNTTQVEVRCSGALDVFGVGIDCTSLSTGTKWMQFTSAGGTDRGSIDWSGSAVRYNTSSDYRLKENVIALPSASERLSQLKPSRFNFIEYPDQTIDGFIAHEVQAVVPEAVSGEKDAVDADGNPVYQGIDQSKLVPLLTAALQEAMERIETLEAEVQALKGGN